MRSRSPLLARARTTRSVSAGISLETRLRTKDVVSCISTRLKMGGLECQTNWLLGHTSRDLNCACSSVIHFAEDSTTVENLACSLRGARSTTAIMPARRDPGNNLCHQSIISEVMQCNANRKNDVGKICGHVREVPLLRYGEPNCSEYHNLGWPKYPLPSPKLGG